MDRSLSDPGNGSELAHGMNERLRVEVASRAEDGRSERQPKSPREPYLSPRITVFGKLCDLTLGGSPGIGDSGDPLNFELVV